MEQTGAYSLRNITPYNKWIASIMGEYVIYSCTHSYKDNLSVNMNKYKIFYILHI